MNKVFPQKPQGWQLSTWGDAQGRSSSGKDKLEFQRHIYIHVNAPEPKTCCVNGWLESGVTQQFPVEMQDDTTALAELAISLKVKCLITECPHSLFFMESIYRDSQRLIHKSLSALIATASNKKQSKCSRTCGWLKKHWNVAWQ